MRQGVGFITWGNRSATTECAQDVIRVVFLIGDVFTPFDHSLPLVYQSLGEEVCWTLDSIPKALNRKLKLPTPLNPKP